MIQHLKSCGVLAARHSALSEISIFMNAAEQIDYLATQFQNASGFCWLEPPLLTR